MTHHDFLMLGATTALVMIVVYIVWLLILGWFERRGMGSTSMVDDPGGI